MIGFFLTQCITRYNDRVILTQSKKISVFEYFQKRMFSIYPKTDIFLHWFKKKRSSSQNIIVG